MQLCAAHDQNSVTGDELSADEKGEGEGEGAVDSQRKDDRKEVGRMRRTGVDVR